MKKVAVIGAGLSGLTLAQGLNQQARVSVFEKSHKVSGRMSSRNIRGFDFDHGAQFFTVRSKSFKKFLQPYLNSGTVKEWTPKVITLAAGEKPYRRPWFEPHYVASPNMDSLSLKISEGLDICLQKQVMRIERSSSGWQLQFADESRSNAYDWVVCTAPAWQSKKLLPSVFNGHEQLESTTLDPCFCLMLGYHSPLPLQFDAAKVKDANIGWIAVNASKPGRSVQYSLQILSSHEWATENFESNDDQIIHSMLDEFQKLFPQKLPEPDVCKLKRWRFAHVSQHAGESFLCDRENQLAACGDWCIEGRVESAFLSAQSLTKTMKGYLLHE